MKYLYDAVKCNGYYLNDPESPAYIRITARKVLRTITVLTASKVLFVFPETNRGIALLIRWSESLVVVFLWGESIRPVAVETVWIRERGGI